MKFCMKCMEQYTDEYEVCPVCGFAEGTMPEDTKCIKCGTILADRYIIGMPLQSDDWLVKYIGWDALNERKISVYEYLPNMYAIRRNNELKITIDKPKPFIKYMKFLKEKAKLLSAFHMPQNISAVYDTFEKNGTLYVTTSYHEGIPLDQYIADCAPISYERAEEFLMPLLQSLDELHESGYVVGGFSPNALVMTSEKKLILTSYLNSLFFNITEETAAMPHTDAQDYFPYERLRSYNPDEILPANDVYSIAMIFYRMLGASVPDCRERIAHYQKSGKDKLKKLRAYRIRLDKNKETAIRNALFINLSDRTPDMETLMKELISEKPVILRTKRNRKTPLLVKIGIPVTAVAVIGVVLAVFLPKSGEVGQTVVPDVFHYTVEKAEEALQEAVLLMEIEGKEITDDLDENLVLSQNIEAGVTVNENTTIGVVVSMHSETVVMPNLLGMRIDSSENVLKKIGIQYTIQTEPSDTVAKNCVMAQSIEPYTEIDINTAVELTVSDGYVYENPEEPVIVQDHTGQNYQDLIDPPNNEDGTAPETSYPVGVEQRVYDPDQPEGTIIGQDTEPESEQEISEPVMLVVTTQMCALTVPDVVLLEKEEAVLYLQQCGLTAEIQEAESEQVKEGLVMEQNPVAGIEIFPDTPIVLTVSTGKPKVEMPSFVGLSKKEAVQLLKEKKLTAKFTYSTNMEIEEDEVIAQDIDAGTMVSQGTAVLITISTKEMVTEIPNLLMLKEETARQMLEDAGLEMKFYYDAGYSEEDDVCIISQYPDAGLSARIGSEVLTIAGDPEKAPSVGSGLMIEPDQVTVKVGEEFILRVEYPGIQEAVNIEYEPEESPYIHYVTFKETDLHTVEMTIEGISAGTQVITIGYGENVRTCEVTVVP